MTVLEAVGAYLQANGHGTLGTNMFYGRMPDAPDVCIGIYEYEGLQPQETFNDGKFGIEMPRIQIVARASREDYPTARDAAVAARDRLAAVLDQTLSGYRVLRIQAVGGVIPLGYDSNDRPKFAVNLQVTVAA